MNISKLIIKDIMIKRIFIILLTFTLIMPSNGQSVQQKMKTTINAEINYLMFLPKTYSEKGTPSPMIVFLHGSGERGNDLEKVKAWGPPSIVEKKPDFPFIVLSPQCPEDQYWNAPLLKVMIDDVIAKYNVDKKKIYLTGLSMGGYGAWDLAMAYPEYFAAISPICGGGNPNLVSQLKDIPVWVFHGKKDDAVPEKESARMVKALKKIGGNVQYTVLPEGGHVDAWVYAYGEAGLFDWFLKQQKK
jgi:predicted peptidase